MPLAASRSLAAIAAVATLARKSPQACLAGECPDQALLNQGARGNSLLQRSTRQGVVVLGDEHELADWGWGTKAPTPVPTPEPNATNTPLREAAASHGVLMGTSLAYSVDEAYRRIVVKHYNLATPETACGWANVRPSPGVFDFTACDAAFDFTTHAMNATWRGSSLVWGELAPAWVEALPDPGAKRNALVEHVQKVIRHYGSRAYVWDVVSQAVTDDATAADPLKKTWTLGSLTKDHAWYPDVPDYIDIVFMAARLAGGSSARLLYNDYHIASCAEGHWMKTKSDRVYALVEGMVNRSIPIDGVGVQMHLDVSWDEPSLYEGTRLNFARYEELGLEVHVSELEVSCQSWSEEVEAQQAEMYAKLLRICLESPACKSFSTNGFTDKSAARGAGRHPLPFDEAFRPKAALTRMVEVLLAPQAPSAKLPSNASASPAPAPSQSPNATLPSDANEISEDVTAA